MDRIQKFFQEIDTSNSKVKSDTKFSIIGKHNHIPDEKFDPIQLKMGIEVEYEHTDCLEISKAIAKDHLSEIKDYYTRLKNMEEEAGVSHHD